MKFVIVSLLLICAILQCAAQNIPNINHKNKPRERKRRPNVQSDELESSAPIKRRPAVQDELEPSAPIRQRKPREDGLASSAPIKKQKKKPSAPREIHRNYNAVKFLSTYDTWPVANSCSKYDESENLYYNVSESRTAMLKWSNLVESSKNRWAGITRIEGRGANREMLLNRMMGGPKNLQCKDGLKMLGEERDGYKMTCGMVNTPTLSTSTSPLAKTNFLLQKKRNKKCVVMSIGSHNEFSFETDVFHNTSCTVHVFDCTLTDGRKSNITSGVVVPQELRSRVLGYNYCLGPKDEVVEGREYKSYESLLMIAGLVKAPTFLKMDIEGYEYGVIHGVLSGNRTDLIPKHIAMEVHFNHPLGPKNYWGKAMFFNYMYRVGSYHLAHWNYNKLCYGCIEVVMARICD